MKHRHGLNKKASWLAGLVLAIASVGCGGVVVEDQDHDGAVADAALSDGAAIDAGMIDGGEPPPPPTLPSSQAQTAGGGSAMSAGYRLHIQIGAPQPMGTASSANHRVRLGSTVE